jgi:hypothetical protein
MRQKLRPEGLKLLAFFTSVAGRFGNVGQGDYGAANETLNRLAWQLHREWPGVRVLSINWGPWDAGMATDAIRAGFRSRGVEPIPVPAGRRFLLDEMAFGPRNDVELVAGQGPWTQAPSAPEQIAPSNASTTEASSGEFPFVRRPPRIGVGGAVTLEHRLSLDADPYLIDHCMDGKPVLPAAAGLEYMAQFVAAGWPEWRVAEMLDVRALSGIVFEGNGHRDLILRARSSTHSEAGQQAVTVEILDPSRKAANYRATAVLMPRLPEAPVADNDLLVGAERMEASRAYSEFLFHGERFRLLRGIDGLSIAGIDAAVMPSTPRAFLGAHVNGARWLFDPGMMDLPPQLAFLWARVHRDMGALPSRFGRVARYGNTPVSGPLSLRMRLKAGAHDLALIYDAQFVDANGLVRVAIFDGESTMSPALNRLAPNHSEFIAGVRA